MANPNKYLAEFLGTILLVVSILASGGQFAVVGGALASFPCPALTSGAKGFMARPGLRWGF